MTQMDISIPLDNDLKLRIEQDPFYSKENMERLMKSIERLEAGQGTYHELIEVDNIV